MDGLKGFTILLLFQLAGEGIVRLLGLPLPAPVLGMVLLLPALLWEPLRRPVQA
ncbi:MAG: CidA/LrgA family protein, partial [Ramlibacter sp.]|nr:CidA/LrgA family protein [Ramlibacter sp.]